MRRGRPLYLYTGTAEDTEAGVRWRGGGECSEEIAQ